MIDVWAGPPAPLCFVRECKQPASHPQAERRWQALCAQNPNLFNAPICAVTGYDPQSGVLRWRPSCYRDLAVQPQVDTGTWQLSTTALLCAHDRVLVARRSVRVHTYPGMYELGPSGGIDPPDGDLDEGVVIADTRREIREEIGLAYDGPARIVGVFRDHLVRSYDILVACEIAEPAIVDAPGWEYEDLVWAPICDPWSVLDPDRVCPPSRAVLSVIADLIGPGGA